MKTRKPNLFIVGAAKSGTSSLAAYLSQHPNIFVSGIKEPAYYVEDAGYDDWDEYISLYSGRDEDILCDSSTGYLYEPSAPSRIKANHPDAKIIIMLRNPIDMAFSYWKYMKIDGNESSVFLDAISNKVRAYRKTQKFRNECENWWCSYLYVERAMYYEQVKRYLDTFGVENVCLLVFEEFIKSQDEYLKNIVSFLMLNEFLSFDTSRVKNSGGDLRSKYLRDVVYHKQYPLLRKIMPPSIREKIRFFVRDINKKSISKNISISNRKVIHNLLSDDVKKLEIGRAHV